MRISRLSIAALASLLGACTELGQTLPPRHFGSVYKPNHFYLEFLPVCWGPEVEKVMAGRPMKAVWRLVVQAVNDGKVPVPKAGREMTVTLRGVDSTKSSVTVVDRYEQPQFPATLRDLGSGTVQTVLPLNRGGLETPRTFWQSSAASFTIEAEELWYQGAWVKKIDSADGTTWFGRIIQEQPAYMTVLPVKCL